MCRGHARVRSRARPRLRSRMNDYGAGGAALFDIVNVQIWTRRRISARSARLLSGRERRRDPFVDFLGAGLAHRAEHSPRKREAGGSSPPASTTVNGRNRPMAGHRFGKAETGVRSAVAAPSMSSWQMHSWRNGRRSRLRSGRRNGVEVQVLPGAPILLASPSGQGIGPTHRHPAVRVRHGAPRF